jgi:hypothetical protein
MRVTRLAIVANATNKNVKLLIMFSPFNSICFGKLKSTVLTISR